MKSAAKREGATMCHPSPQRYAVVGLSPGRPAARGCAGMLHAPDGLFSIWRTRSRVSSNFCPISWGVGLVAGQAEVEPDHVRLAGVEHVQRAFDLPAADCPSSWTPRGWGGRRSSSGPSWCRCHRLRAEGVHAHVPAHVVQRELHLLQGHLQHLASSLAVGGRSHIPVPAWRMPC